MSGGQPCTCSGSQAERRRHWRVFQRHCNFSAFSGYHYTPSAYSGVFCLNCDGTWRTTAKYVVGIPNGDLSERYANAVYRSSRARLQDIEGKDLKSSGFCSAPEEGP
jgi:hypothetical protein